MDALHEGAFGSTCTCGASELAARASEVGAVADAGVLLQAAAAAVAAAAAGDLAEKVLLGDDGKGNCQRRTVSAPAQRHVVCRCVARGVLDLESHVDAGCEGDGAVERHSSAIQEHRAEACRLPDALKGIHASLIGTQQAKEDGSERPQHGGGRHPRQRCSSIGDVDQGHHSLSKELSPAHKPHSKPGPEAEAGRAGIEVAVKAKLGHIAADGLR